MHSNLIITAQFQCQKLTPNWQSICSKNWRYIEMETWQTFSRVPVKTKIFKELFTFIWNKIAVSVRCILCTSRFRREIERFVAKRRNMKLFLKWNIDIAIQWQAFSMHTLISQLYILQCINKKHPFTGYPKAKHQNIANSGLETYKKNQWFFYGIAFC